MSLPGVNAAYNRMLCRNYNPFRWAEYSVSASCMTVMIAQLCGVADVFLMAALFGLMASCMLFGWQMELLNGERLPTYTYTDDPTASPEPKALEAENGNGGAQFVSDARGSMAAATPAPITTRKVDWSPFLFGCIPFMVALVILWYYFFQASIQGDPPGFVYSIIIILSVLYCTFALIQWFQFAQLRGFRGFAKAEIWYMVASLTSKQLLAWITYGGTRRFQSE